MRIQPIIATESTMFSLLRKLFGRLQTRKDFQFLIVDRGEEIENNRWYRMSHWKSPHFLKMDTNWDKGWKTFLSEEEVVGVTHEHRQRKFLVMGDLPDFGVSLERDPKNPHDKNAIKVMACATVNGSPTVAHLGFLSRETARLLKDEKELDARPYSVYLPYEGRRFGLKIRVLTRSQAYKKKTGQPTATKKRARKKARVIKSDIRKDAFDDVYDFLDDAREDYECKKVAKKLFKQVFDEFFDAALKRRGLSEEQLNAEENDHDLDLSDDLIEALDEIVDRLFVINPELEKRG